MVISSSSVSMHEGVAYHRSGGAAQDILEIDRVEGVGRRNTTRSRQAVGIETQQGCPLNVQGL